MRRLVGIVLVVLVVGILLLALRPGTPARTFGAYELKAKDTAESVLSSVETARLVAQAASRGRAFGPYVSVSLSETETGIGDASSSFSSLQPPDDHADRLRAELTRTVARAEDLVADLRVSARRGELAMLEDDALPLARVAAKLRRFADEHG